MHGPEDSTSGTVLQRLMQEHLRYGASGPGEATEGNSSHMPSSPAFTENLEDQLYQSVLSQSQPRQEPQGQEYQVDSSTMEKTTAGVSQGGGGPGFDNVQLPSYEEAKIQSQLYRGQHSPTDLQSQNQGHQSFESHENQHMFLSVWDSPTGSHSCPPSLSSAYSLSSSPSLSTLSTSLPAVLVKADAESRPWFQQGGGASLPGEGLTELKHGHVHSLSERIMQLNLERNGTKQSVGSSGSSSAGDSSHGDESAENSPPATSSSSKWFLEERGPPPEYPFKFPVQTTLPPALNTNIGSLDYAHLHDDTLTSAMPEQARPCSVSLGASQQQNSPVSEMCVLPSSQASQQQYQPVSQSRALGFPPAQVESVNHGPSVRLAPLGQPFPGEVFAMVSHTQQMLENLNEENQSLKQELQKQNEKASRLKRLELEIERLSETYESLVKSSSKREALDKTMRNKLEGEIRRLHDFNRDLRDRLETANRQLANQEVKVQEDGHLYLSQRRESLKDLEKLQIEAASLRSANEDQQHHIDILEQALDNAQSKVIRLEEELSKKQMYVERVERLQQALAQLQAACEKREQLERRLRNRLERELEVLRTQQRAGVGVTLGVGESSAPALLDLLREREERILGLEADMTRWEQKYLEESAMRHFAMEAAATAAAQRDRTIFQHSRSGSYSDGSLWQHEDDNSPQSGRRCQEMEQRMKNLHAQLLEKDAMIKVLQQRSRREPAPLRPARSVPSISITTGLHVRQTSQTDHRDQRGWRGSTSLLLGQDTGEHLLPSLPSLSVSSVPSPLPPSFSSSLPSSFPPFLASAGSSTSLTRLSSCLPRSSPPSSSCTLPLLSSSPLTPLASFSLPSTPLMSLHSKSASRDRGRQTEMFRTSTRQHKTEFLSGQTKVVEGRAQLSGGQKMALPDLDLLEILI
ncbi:Angiomotin-like protein 1 [Triplophysa tibetana]|uniref:Angiomotin-like protein 1 n=1 Tax=Triplophysa tibetana TaxID=1572043 RepID=A0A5A9MZ13_9TELE|nr:Angiomotin-like protein 1 [Triplophysa tibetana]